MIGIGIDFGTTNSAIAVFDGTSVEVVKLELKFETSPTAIHLSNEYQSTVAREAIEQYVSENIGRRVELTSKLIGFAAASVEQAMAGGGRVPIYGEPEDHQLPGRLFLSIKRQLGEVSSERIKVFNKQYRLVALITPFIKFIKESLAAEDFRNCKTVCLGRPVEFEGSYSGKNELAQDRLKEVSDYAELSNIRFFYEPVAAILSFLEARNISQNCNLLSVDFGGGTLDLSLVKFEDKRFEVIGNLGLSLGGDLIDKLLYEELIFPEIGKGVLWKRIVDGKEIVTEFPFAKFENSLLNWSITYTLNQNEFLSDIYSCINDTKVGSEKLTRLKDLIIGNMNYSVFQKIKQAKENLATKDCTWIRLEELDLEIKLDRQKLDMIVKDAIKRIREAIFYLLEKSGYSRENIDFVIRTGGSSRLLAVEALLESIFPGKVEPHETFTSVARGLAIASYQGIELEQT